LGVTVYEKEHYIENLSYMRYVRQAIPRILHINGFTGNCDPFWENPPKQGFYFFTFLYLQKPCKSKDEVFKGCTNIATRSAWSY